MPCVVDHLSILDLEQRFRSCADPVEARHVQVIWLLAQGHTVGATSKVTAFGTRWIQQLLERYNASGPDALANGRRRNGLKPSLLTAEVLAAARLRLAEPAPDGGLWSSRKVADVMAAHLGLERVLPQRGWEALKALGWSLQRPQPKNPKSATAEEAAAFKKRMARPVGKQLLGVRLDLSAQTYPAFRRAVGQDGEPRVLVLIKLSASSAIFLTRVPKHRLTVRPSPRRHPQTSRADTRPRQPIRFQAARAAAL